MKKTEKIIKALNALIAERGFEGLYENPKEVYSYLREKKAESALSKALSYALLFDVGRSGEDVEDGIASLSLTKAVSAGLIEIFHAVYSEEHISSLTEEKKKALEEFCSAEHDIRISGKADWKSKKHYTLHCSYRFDLTISVYDRKIVEEEMAAFLKNKSSVTAADIVLYYRRELEKEVDDDFGDFCGDAEDYYEPYVEGYDDESGISVIEDYLEEHGLELVSYSFSGDTDDDNW